MLRPLLLRAAQWQKPLCALNHEIGFPHSWFHLILQFPAQPTSCFWFVGGLKRGIHSRNKKAMELVAKGWSALQEVDRVIDYAELKDPRLFPLLRGAKENFELALEIDNMNTHARYWLGKMHFKYHVPGACKLIGAALLVEAANMGDADAQYELGSRLRVENDYVQSDQQAFYYLEKAVDQLHPGALYLLGAVYLTGNCVKQDLASAMWCFHRASEKGHAAAAIAFGSLLLKGVEVPEVLTRFDSNKSPSYWRSEEERGESSCGPSEEGKGAVSDCCKCRVRPRFAMVEEAH